MQRCCAAARYRGNRAHVNVAYAFAMQVLAVHVMAMHVVFHSDRQATPAKEKKGNKETPVKEKKGKGGAPAKASKKGPKARGLAPWRRPYDIASSVWCFIFLSSCFLTSNA